MCQVLRMDKDELQAKMAALDKSREEGGEGVMESDDEDWMSDDEDQDEISSGTLLCLGVLASQHMIPLVSYCL